MFFQQAFQLIQTLPILFNDEPIPLILYNFIQHSVNFWIKVIPPPQNEGSKYTIETLSEGVDYFSNIIHQFQSQQNGSDPPTSTSSELQLPTHTTNEESQDNSFRENLDKSSDPPSQIPHKHIQTSEDNIQGSEESNPNFSDKIENSIPLDQTIISQISECFNLLFPSTEANPEITPLEQLTFIRTTIEAHTFFSEQTNSTDFSDLIEIF
jgi:hypothetical protein